MFFVWRHKGGVWDSVMGCGVLWDLALVHSSSSSSPVFTRFRFFALEECTYVAFWVATVSGRVTLAHIWCMEVNNGTRTPHTQRQVCVGINDFVAEVYLFAFWVLSVLYWILNVNIKRRRGEVNICIFVMSCTSSYGFLKTIVGQRYSQRVHWCSIVI